MSAVTHKLSLEVERSSTAVWKWWKLRRGPIKSYVEGETYDIAFKFKNLGLLDYPGGSAELMIKWTSESLFIVWLVTIPKIRIGDEGYAVFDDNKRTRSDTVNSSGLGTNSLIYVGSADDGTVTVTDPSGRITYRADPYVIHSIPATTWTDLYAKYSMIISAAGLFIVALDRIVAALLWMFHL